MLPKYFTLISTFLISPEARDLLGFYCRAFLVYSIMLLTLILTPIFGSPILEENAVSVRNDTFTCTATSSQLLNQKIQVNPWQLCFQSSFMILQDTDFVLL